MAAVRQTSVGCIGTVGVSARPVADRSANLQNPAKANDQVRRPVSPEQALRAYFHAKDENRPHLLDGVFASDARLGIRNRSEPRGMWPVRMDFSARASVTGDAAHHNDRCDAGP